MSSPISIYIRNLRMQTGMTQNDFARALGYEQATVSSIEIDRKSPSAAFLATLVETFQLSEVDQADLKNAVRNSKKRFSLPGDASAETYTFCNDLWSDIERINPSLLQAMHLMLKVEKQLGRRPDNLTTRLQQSRKSGVTA